MDIFHNSTFVVGLAFILFIGVLFKYKVPGLVLGLLDKRADTIRAELDEARRLREEAQSLLASYERKQKEAEEQVADIIAHARTEAEDAAVEARASIKDSVARRLKAAEEQIASAEAAALKAVRDRAVTVAVSVAADMMAKNMSAADGARMIDDSIGEVAAKLH